MDGRPFGYAETTLQRERRFADVETKKSRRGQT